MSPEEGDRSLANAMHVTLEQTLEPTLAPGGHWDRLLANSPANSVFLTAGFLRAAHTAYARSADILLPTVWRHGELIAAAAFLVEQGIARFFGTGPSDYLDFVLRSDLAEPAALEAIRLILRSVYDEVPGLRQFELRNIPEENGTPARLALLAPAYKATVLRGTAAPTMDMAAAPAALQKKSFRRHENALARSGTLTCETWVRAEDILPRLPQLFEQHVRRWHGTSSPSLFEQAEHRYFFEEMVKNLGPTNCLRYTEVKLDSKIVAIHLGSVFAGRFTWYKPSYEPEFARYSPGEVLLKRLIERAQQEEVAEFDFTIGDEAFKMRFATRVRNVVDLHVTRSAVRAGWTRTRLSGKRLVRSLLTRAGLWESLKRWSGR